MTISIDSLLPDRFRRITQRADLQPVLEGIEAARQAGFGPLKFNAVIERGVNEDEILDLAEFARTHGDEMRFIVLRSMQEYPMQQIETAFAATASQLGQSATGHGINDQIWHTYGIIKRFIPGEVPAMQKARQQRGALHFDLINRVHVPIALGSMLLAFLLLASALARGRFDPLARLAATVTVALLANAFVCGALSGPHDRYGARIAWIATLTAAIVILQGLKSYAAERERRAGNAVVP